MWRITLPFLLLASGCGSLDAEKACAKLSSAGATGCKEAKLEGLAYVVAGRGFEFSVEGVEKPGKVIDFADAEKFKATRDALVGFSRISGAHVFANEKRLVIVELHQDTPKDKVEPFKTAVEGW